MTSETPKFHQFDTQGFLFLVKIAIVVIILVGGTHVTLSVLYPSAEDAMRLSERSAENSSQASMGEVIRPNNAEGEASVIANKLNEIKATAGGQIAHTIEVMKRIISPKRIDQVVPSAGKFIAANLESMQLELYVDGSMTASYPILSKGREGSRWETPTGFYSIKTKERNHFSSIGEVYMPYSMQFYGNFFIHGWPYYANGNSVPVSYSGGCIRLSTDDARKVYEFATVGTSVYVFDLTSMADPNDSNGSSIDAPDVVSIRSVNAANALGAITDVQTPEPEEGETDAQTTGIIEDVPDLAPTKDPNTLELSAESYLIGQLDDGQILLESGADDIHPIASISKLMTAIVSNDAMTYDRDIVITDSILETPGDSGHLASGEIFTATELLYPMLMESSNDAAAAFAVSYGYDSFIKLMNSKAKALGMENTSYKDSSGLNSGNVSTVSDLFRLAQYLFFKQQFILSITKKPTYSMATSSAHNGHTLNNFNVFSAWPNFVGGKTGTTDAAKEAMISVFKVKTSDDKSKNIAIIVLRSENRVKDTQTLYSWYVRNFGFQAGQ